MKLENITEVADVSDAQCSTNAGKNLASHCNTI